MRVIKREAATVVGFLTLFCVVLLGPLIQPENAGWALSGFFLSVLFLVMLWLAFAVVRHAECLGVILGEPYGTLILTLSVIGIEVALIASVMIAGSDKPTLARDTMFSVVMIVLNGLVGLSILIGGLKHRVQEFNLQGANAYISVLIPLATVSLILPRFTPSAPGGQLSALQVFFLIGMSVILYSVFLAIQTISHADIFRQSEKGEGGHHPELDLKSVPYHGVALLAAMLPIVLLSKSLAKYVDYGIENLGAPIALGGFLIAILILTPEGLSAINAARRNELQRAVNICLGSSLATIGMTVPAVLVISRVTGEAIELGLNNPDIVMLSVTLVVSLVTFVSGRTHALLGVVHLALFAAYVMLIFDNSV